MAAKMDKTTIMVVAIVGSMGLLSAILGFSAEGTKLTVSSHPLNCSPCVVLIYVHVFLLLVDVVSRLQLSDLLVGDGFCYYPKNSALALAVCAAIFLIIAQVTFAVLGGCCGCCKSRAMPSETNRIIGLVCAIVSW